MATLTTVLAGDISLAATYGGTAPTAADTIVIAHVSCFLPFGTSLTVAAFSTSGSASKLCQINGTLTVTGHLFSAQSNAIVVNSGGVANLNTISMQNGYDPTNYTVRNSGGTINISGGVSVSGNGDPRYGVLTVSGTTNVTAGFCSVNTNSNFAIGFRIVGGTLNIPSGYALSVSGGGNAAQTPALVGIDVAGGTVNFLGVISNSTVKGHGIRITAGTLNLGPFAVATNNAPGAPHIYIGGGTVNVNASSVLNVQASSVAQIQIVSGTLNLQNLTVNATGIFRLDVLGGTVNYDGTTQFNSVSGGFIQVPIAALMPSSGAGYYNPFKQPVRIG